MRKKCDLGWCECGMDVGESVTSYKKRYAEVWKPVSATKKKKYP